MESEYSRVWKTYQERDNIRDMFIQSLPRIKDDLPGLSNIKSCVMIGCGYGRLELDFVSLYGCLENVKEIAAVEPDAKQLAKLKNRVAQLLPTMSANFYEETAGTWKGVDKPFDAVLVFESVYFLFPSERASLFKKLFDNVVANGGFVFMFQSEYVFSCPITSLGRVVKRLGISYPSAEVAEVRNEMTSAGFRLCYELPIRCELNCEKLDDEFMSMFVYWSEGTVTLESVREVAEEEFGGRKTDPYTMIFQAFRKP